MIVDDQSPPGAWASEMKAAPWAFGQQERNIRLALTTIRKAGLWHEAEVLERRISALEAAIEAPLR